MINIVDKIGEKIVLKAIFEEDILANDKLTIKKDFHITEFLSQKKAFIFLGKKAELTRCKFKKALDPIMTYLENRSVTIDIESFSTEYFCYQFVATRLVDKFIFKFGKTYSQKTNKKEDKPELELFVSKENDTDELKAKIEKTRIIAKAVNFARYFQTMPPNICNSEYLADAIVEKIKKHSTNVSVKVLNKKEITDLGMGLFLSVNRGSVYEPRTVVLEYKGDPSSDKKTVLVGKGITFDSGGYNIKTGRFMNGMKFDMSGAIIAAAAIKAMSKLNAKKNFSAVLQLTDNRVNGDASLPDSVWTSMNGKTVEVNNTDAEGRLALADGITYAIRNLGATKIIDIATLTGAIVVALGDTYTGVWSTCDGAWEEFAHAAKHAGELVWRMPFHENFAKNIKKSTLADLKNTDLTGKGGSNSAAMFLKEFTEGKKYIHLDIAGTADIDEQAQGVMVKTIVELALLKNN